MDDKTLKIISKLYKQFNENFKMGFYIVTSDDRR